MWRAWKKQDLQVQLGDWHMLMQETLGREKLMHQHQNRELMGWREQPACSPKASWGPTCIIIYQGKALLGLHHLPSETSVFTVVPCRGSVDVGSPGSPVGCVVCHYATWPHGKGCSSSSWALLCLSSVQASGCLLLPWSSKTCSYRWAL